MISDLVLAIAITRYSLDDEGIAFLAEQLKMKKKEELVERLCQFIIDGFGHLYFEKVIKQIPSSSLKNRCTQQLLFFQRVQKILAEGGESKKIQELEPIKKRLAQRSYYSSITPQEILTQGIVDCLISLPMPLQQTMILPKVPIPLFAIQRREEEISQQVGRLFCLLDPSNLPFTEEKISRLKLLLSFLHFDRESSPGVLIIAYMNPKKLQFSEEEIVPLEQVFHRNAGIVSGNDFYSWEALTRQWISIYPACRVYLEKLREQFHLTHLIKKEEETTQSVVARNLEERPFKEFVIDRTLQVIAENSRIALRRELKDALFLACSESEKARKELLFFDRLRASSCPAVQRFLMAYQTYSGFSPTCDLTPLFELLYFCSKEQLAQFSADLQQDRLTLSRYTKVVVAVQTLENILQGALPKEKRLPLFFALKEKFSCESVYPMRNGFSLLPEREFLALEIPLRTCYAIQSEYDESLRDTLLPQIQKAIKSSQNTTPKYLSLPLAVTVDKVSVTQLPLSYVFHPPHNELILAYTYKNEKIELPLTYGNLVEHPSFAHLIKWHLLQLKAHFYKNLKSR